MVTDSFELTSNLDYTTVLDTYCTLSTRGRTVDISHPAVSTSTASGYLTYELSVSTPHGKSPNNYECLYGYAYFRKLPTCEQAPNDYVYVELISEKSRRE